MGLPLLALALALAPQGRAISVKALLRVGPAARAAAAGSARMLRLSATATKQVRGRRPHLGVTVLYVDRGVIVVNKPPGLVSQSQGNAATRSTAAAVVAPAPPSQALAFNDVLEGKLRTFFFFRSRFHFHTVTCTAVRPKSHRAVSIFFFFKACDESLTSEKFRIRFIA